MIEDQELGDADGPSEPGASEPPGPEGRPRWAWWAVAAAVVVAVVVAAVLLLSGGDDDDGDVDSPLAGCGGSNAAPTSLDGIDYPSATVKITTPQGDVERACVLLADTAPRRQHGLMRVTDFGKHAGMVFVQDTDTAGPFWMFNTPTPLSIAWFASDGTYVNAKDMEPCAMDPMCPTYAPGGLYRFALEVPKGRLGDYGVEPGSKLEIVPADLP